MSATIIKNGTVVTADLSYKADVRVEGGVITEIGPNLTGGTVLDATGCYVMPGGIDPHTHLEMPFMGTYSADDFESGTRAALSGTPYPVPMSTEITWLTQEAYDRLEQAFLDYEESLDEQFNAYLPFEQAED